MKYLTRLFFCALSIFLVSCQEVNTTDPEEALDHWLGINPSEEVTPINAKYWQSAHLFKEYTLFMELDASEEWIEGFISQNSLRRGSVDMHVNGLNFPEWFMAGQPEGFVPYKKDMYDVSFYLIHKEEGKVFVFESQW
ncbi:hypothetical protein OO013_07245 [Mangrovivirga sp. M17]|uniref:Uncharacterized protein n=1 Tax=Mangrovivirga halotolerans TaxID=2993936 RepID=A0ABT3RQN5_9BACT|nr:hypothetical protein [Mangrovivirga halotolerans]MCX2743653.1 hypothetical protein [Mangrovivirga halotolerans]